MDAALALAARGLGSVWPNPAVGCVIVCPEAGAGRVIGRGWTQPGGRPHAETEALRRAGSAARGATAYVSLEPCSHHGRTPPCADALIAAGIARCVVACTDPDSRVAGQGVERLRTAGITVTIGVRETEARRLNAGFFLRITDGRPLVTLKTATTLDGRIATASGESQWITGAEARALTHRLRAEHDAVVVGSGTALADDPELTCRLPGGVPRPGVRVVFDSRLRLPLDSRLVGTVGTAPLWLVTRSDHPPAALDAYRARGVDVVTVDPGGDGRVDVAAALRALGGRGLTRVLVEGGGVLAASLLQEGLVDRLVWFHAPKVLGADARAAVGKLGLDRLDDSPDFSRLAAFPVGNDVAVFFERQ